MKDKSLIVDLNSIPYEGREIPLHLGKDWFSRWQDDDPELEFSGAGPLTGRVHLSRHGKDVLVRGQIEGRLKLTCGRCLEAFELPIAADFDLLLAPGPEPVSDKEEELSTPELDLDFYSDEIVDLEGIIKEQIILQIPLKPLCREDCRGLCPHCGADLNQGKCACSEAKFDSPFAALGRLKE
jgi:uncharacterized protein